MEKITIQDIARDAGVSIATVSRAINPHTNWLVTPPTRKKILDIVRKTGYLPSPIAKRLATGKSTNIVIFIGTKQESMFYSDYYMKLLAGAMKVIEDSQFNLIIRLIKLRENTFDLSKVIRGMDIGGAIICDWKDILEVSTRGFEGVRIPSVVLNRAFKIPGVSCIACDNFKSGYDATNYLIGLGHRNIAVIRGGYDEKDAIDRLEGYKMALFERSLPINDSYIYEGDFSEETGIRAVKRFIGLQNRPTAIFATNDEIALGAFMKLSEMSFRCPKDVSLIGFDGIYAGGYLVPKLATMVQPIAEMAQTAVKEVVRCLSNGGEMEKIKLFDAKLSKGGTCGAPPYMAAESKVSVGV